MSFSVLCKKKSTDFSDLFTGSPDKLTTEEKQPTPHKIQFKAEEDTIFLKEEKLSEVFEADGTCDERKVKALKAKRKLNVNQSLNQDAAPTNHKLTEYFTVRRSVRKPKTAILEEKQRNLEEAVLSGKEDGLRVTKNKYNVVINLSLNLSFYEF
jgi:hypothetical protein